MTAPLNTHGCRRSPVAKTVKPVRLRWRVVIDTAEQHAFSFTDIKADAAFYRKWELCQKTNPNRIDDIEKAMTGADVLIALSKPGPDTVKPAWIRKMAAKAIVFACANPVPEIWPWEAKAAGAVVVATGRSDFDNQVNNSLGFPGIFRGTLDVRARTITDEMCFAAAKALADHIGSNLSANQILPTMDDWEIFPREAAAVAVKAQEQGLARLSISYEDEFKQAMDIISRSRNLTQMMMKDGFIAQAPV